MTGDRQRDGVGYDLDFASPHGAKKVEVKGIGSSDLAFNLTAKEYATSLSDPDWMLVAVTDALGAAHVRIVDSAELHRLAIEPTQYRVRE